MLSPKRKIERFAEGFILSQAVTRTPAPSLSRLLCVALMLASWLVLSNHCALGELSANASASLDHSSCCGNHSGKDSQPVKDGTRECCKTLRVVVFDSGSKIAKIDLQSFFFAWETLTLPSWAHVRPAINLNLLETGPPRVASFAEMVLQGSLFSHAPPFAV